MTSYLMFDVYLRNYICFSNVIQEEGDMYEIMIHTSSVHVFTVIMQPSARRFNTKSNYMKLK